MKDTILWGLAVVALGRSPRLRWLVSAIPIAMGVYHLIQRYPRTPAAASDGSKLENPIRVEAARYAAVPERQRWHS